MFLFSYRSSLNSKKTIWQIVILSALSLLPLHSIAQTLWSPAQLPQARGESILSFLPNKYSLFELDEAAMRSALNRAARGMDTISKQLDIPLPTGEIIQVTINETQTMAAGLAAKFPQIKTYKATVVGRPSVTGVVDLSELGFHGMLFMENGQRLFIDPRHDKAGNVYYISYYDKDYAPSGKKRPACFVDQQNHQAMKTLQSADDAFQNRIKQRLAQRSGASVRTYRLAMAATGEYTAYHGGTKALALSAINTTVARVNEIYQRDFAVKFELVANNDQIIFTDPNSDPYTDNEDGNQLSDENQIAVDQNIGTSNYDIGHIITHNSGGGIAQFKSLCQDDVKAQGMTGHETPKNDPFDIDYVAHEMGHQLGGNHTFNSTTSGCNDNRNADTAWEIGAGVTIMGYVGVCETQDDVQSNSDAMFHVGSIRQMSDYIDDVSGGSSCGTANSQGNQQPVANAGKDYSIPAQTPFTLTGSATDADNGQNLTYSWEQMDLGNGATIADGDKGDNPLFRTFLPSSVSSRTFPQLSDILNNTQTKGEILPSTNRELNFTLSVRDQQGGVGDDDVKLTVVNTGSAFKITSHTAQSTITAGETTDVTWEVANTTASPISCANVDILLSIDGGQSFATTLTSATSNDGSETVTIPSNLAANNTTRLKVACSDNIFFDISDANLSLASSSTTKTAETTFNEGSSDHTNYFRLALSSALTVDASVDYETRNGSGTNAAIAGEDYVAKSGTATIPAGETTLLIGVTIKGDTTPENNETFSLVISNPVNGQFPTGVTEVSATHTILNDD